MTLAHRIVCIVLAPRWLHSVHSRIHPQVAAEATRLGDPNHYVVGGYIAEVGQCSLCRLATWLLLETQAR